MSHHIFFKVCFLRICRENPWIVALYNFQGFFRPILIQYSSIESSMSEPGASKPPYSIEFLPKQWDDSEKLKRTAALFSDLRLRSLQLSPEAFASTYDQEVKTTIETSLQRLQNRNAQQIIATAPGQPREGSQGEVISEWKGMIVVLEKEATDVMDADVSPWATNQKKMVPKEHQVQTASSEMAPMSCSGDSSTPIFYTINGVFVDPSLRRSGLGKVLVREAISYVKKKLLEKELSAVRVDVSVFSENAAAIGLYSSCGFNIVGETECKGPSLLGRKVTNMSQLVYVNPN
jgi:ribosomal protein S18 acetylase RimI-like enzyme